MKSKIFNSVFFQIGVLALSICILLVLALFGYLAFKVTKNENESKALTANFVSHSVLDKIDRNFYERFGDVQAFAFNKLAKNALLNKGSDLNDLQDFINTMTSYYVLYDLMMLCDKDGHVIAVNTQDKGGNKIKVEKFYTKNVKNEVWFTACLANPGPEGGAWYSKFQSDPEIAEIYNSKGYGLGFAAPVKDSSGQVLGVWYNFASWKEITQSIREEAEADLNVSNPGSSIIITRNTGEIIDANDDDLISDGNIVQENDESNKELNFHDKTVDLRNFVCKWATAKGAYTYKGLNWKAITLIPKSEIGFATVFSKELITIYLTVLALFSATVFFIYVKMKNSVISKLNKIVEYINKQSEGEIISVEAELKTEDEMGKIVSALDKMAINIKNTAHFADKIGNGELGAQHEISGPKDVLGISLINMRNKLMILRQEETQRNWITEGIAVFADLVRKVYSNEDALLSEVIKSLIKYIEANQGMMFTEENGRLKLVACYAWGRKKHLNETIEIGEGLTGQAFLERETIYVTEIPTSYIKITSGLGEAQPGCILIVPIKLDEEVLGIIEIASFSLLPNYKIQFVEKTAEIIASTLKSTNVSIQTRKLLEESQTMGEQLRAQEEEMRQNMEELHATQEELKRRETDLLKELNQLRKDSQEQTFNLA